MQHDSMNFTLTFTIILLFIIVISSMWQSAGLLYQAYLTVTSTFALVHAIKAYEGMEECLQSLLTFVLDEG